MSMPEDVRSENADRPSDAWMDARVEAFVDGSLAPDERAAFEAHLHATPHWQQAVRQARRLQARLRSLPQAKGCPSAVTQAVFARTTRERALREPMPRPDRAARPAARAEPPAVRKAAAVLAILLAVAAATALLGRPAPDGTPTYTRADVERAEAEAEWALALVAQATRQAGQSVRRGVLREHVAAPVRRAVVPVLTGLPPLPQAIPADSSTSAPR